MNFRRILVALCVCSTSCSCGAIGLPHPVWSNASLNGTYEVVTTLKPYVKFAGGPQLGSGRLIFDGKGVFSGEQTYEGERDKLSETYQIDPDGSGFAYLTSVGPDGTVTQSEYSLKIQNDNKILAASYGLPVTTDWLSADHLIQNGQPAFTSVLTRIQDPAGSTVSQVRRAQDCPGLLRNAGLAASIWCQG